MTRCPKCRIENNDDALFCEQCGTRLELSCPACGAPVNHGARFCKKCGSQIGERPTSTAPIHAQPELREAPTGERRHLTVLFCDLAGSTAIAAQLDPEEWRETVSSYQRAAADAITRFDGHVAKYLGDGVLAFFGYPQAHDDDAERAARAGLEILDAIAKLNQRPGQPRLAARVGIDSGAVVVGQGAGKDADVFGDTPNIAARVQEAATPGTVLVTEDTHRLISGLFVVEERGAPALKGIERSRQLYRVIRPSGVRGRLQAAAAAHGLTPFVGREDELHSLMHRWEQVQDGDGQVALIIGEAGIGKSRLVTRFHEQIAAAPHTWIEAGAGAFFQNTPFHPVSEMLKQATGWRGNEPAEQQVAQLESALELARLKPAEAIPLLAPLLNLAPSQKYPASSLPPEQQRRRLLATLVELALGLARVQPTVTAIEDLHWADPSTLELIQLLVEQGARSRLLLLCTARPEFHAQWPPRPQLTQITLERLGADNVRAMVHELAARAVLSAQTTAAVVERTGGVPLFVEELTRAVLESGGAMLTGSEIPATLHDSLMARLDRLGPAKEVIQVGAVIGSEFSYDLIHAVYPVAQAELDRSLRRLTDAELLYVRGAAPQSTYHFKHALIHDAAYEALLKSRRKELHRLIARALDQHFADVKDAHPEVLARHWTEAGEIEPAIAQWSKAGEAARARDAFMETAESFRQALALLKRLPQSPEREVRELQILEAGFIPIFLTKGHSAPETTEVRERMAVLRGGGDKLEQRAMSVLVKGYDVLEVGDLAAAGSFADQAMELALQQGHPTILWLAHLLQMNARSARGDLAGVEKYFTAGLEFFNDPEFKTIPGQTVYYFGTATLNAWAIGRADAARDRIRQMTAAIDSSNPYDLAFSAFYAAALRLFLREYDQAQVLAAHALELCEKHMLQSIGAHTRLILGAARAHLGRATEGVALIRTARDHLLEAHANTYNCTVSLAAAQERAGDLADALETIEQALRQSPEAHRIGALTLRGELRLRQGQIQLAEADLREGLAGARTTGAKAPELQITMSLARLLDQQGRRDEARSMLAEIYNWFSEGFDTPDLKDAKALLEELGA